MLTIDTYTARFDAAVRPRVEIKRGMHVRVAESPDGREWDGFYRRVEAAGLELEFVRWMPRAKLNVYRLVQAAKR